MVDEVRQREYGFSRVFNFRDLGGHPTTDGRTVRWRRLFRSDTLSNLTDPDREPFQRLGIRTVIDLRRDYELAADGTVPPWDGVTHHNIDPGHPEWSLTPYQDGLDPQRYLADRYRDMAETGAPGLARAVAMLADADTAPAVVHCVAGKDRTGVVCALTLSLLGVDDEVIDADYAHSSIGNQRYIAWIQRNGRPEAVMRPWFYSHPGTMRLFLQELRERHGSVEDYVGKAGLGPERITALREHLLE